MCAASAHHGGHVEGLFPGRAPAAGGQSRCGQEQGGGQVPSSPQPPQGVSSATQVCMCNALKA